MWNTNGTLNTDLANKKSYAGHQAGTTWKKDVGTVAAGGSADHGDVAIVNVDTANKVSGDHIWWDGRTSSNKLPVTQRFAPTIGDPVCADGEESGADCGLTIFDTNINWTYDTDGTVKNADLAKSSSFSDCSVSGDSGGPIVYDNDGAETQAFVIGVISGSAFNSASCYEVFTGIEEAIQTWGGNVKFVS